MKFTITWNNVTYEVEVEETEKPGQLRVKVAGVEHLVDVVQKKNPGRQPHKPQTPRPQPTPAPSAGGVVSAPLPGVVLFLPVKVGDKVRPSDIICVIEAMKMETQIRAGRAGTVAEVMVSVGDKVETGQALIRIG